MDEIDEEPGRMVRRPGMTFVCEVPGPLGRVTKLSVKGGKLVAETESGVPLIVPATAG